MKLSQTRLREIIQEEVARMNEDEERSFRKEFLKALGASNLKPTSRAIEMVLDVYEDSWVDAGDDRYLQDSAVADTVAALKLPPFNLKPEPKKELEEAKPGDLDQTLARDPERTIGQQNAIETVRKEFTKELGSLTGIDPGEADIFKFLLEVLKLLKNKNANTTAMRTALGITHKAAEKIAK